MSAENANTPMFPSGAAAVTPSDTATFTPGAIYVGSGGNVAVLPADGQPSVTFVNVPSGTVVPVLVRGVMATGTTAGSLVVVR